MRRRLSSGSHLAEVLRQRGQSEVGDLQAAVFIQKKVLWFDVSMTHLYVWNGAPDYGA